MSSLLSSSSASDWDIELTAPPAHTSVPSVSLPAPAGADAPALASASASSSTVSVASAAAAPAAAGKPAPSSSEPSPPASIVSPDYAIPKLTHGEIFVKFFLFGTRAFGGPVAQIASMKQALVTDEKWISPARFNRVLAVYQALPGPEATELACYFGMLAGGRLGSVLGGLGFLLPGLVLVLCAAWLYASFGVNVASFNATLLAVQPVVLAMFFRAVHKIGQSSVTDDAGAPVGGLAAAAVLAAVESVMGVNFFVALAHGGLLYAVFLRRPEAAWRYGGGAFAALPLAAFVAVIVARGGAPIADIMPVGIGVAASLGRSAGTSFVVGLIGGMLTFGGAYTAIPIVQYETVTVGAWLSPQQFLDGIAIAQVLPTPLVTFVAFVGYLGTGLGGALLMTLGMFLPAFSFTLIGHDFFERLVEAEGMAKHFLDGVSASVVGLIAVTAVQFAKAAIVRPVDCLLFGGALLVLYRSKEPMAPTILVAAAALCGVILQDAGVPALRSQIVNYYGNFTAAIANATAAIASG